MADRSAKQELDKRREFNREALPHMDALYRTALRMTKNAQDAEDLVQEAFVKAYRFWDKFEPELPGQAGKSRGAPRSPMKEIS